MQFDLTGPLPGGTTALEASAGTGKTFTIAGIVNRLITETDTRIEDILIVTFGERASAELRSRVRSRLERSRERIAWALAGSISPSVWEVHIDDLDSLVIGPIDSLHPRVLLESNDERLRVALADIDRATISTIHSFCTTALDRLGVKGTPSTRELIEVTDELKQQVIDDVYLRLFLEETSEEVPSYADAAELGDLVLENPRAQLLPSLQDEEDQEVSYRRAFGQEVREEFAKRTKVNGVMTFNEVLTSLADIVAPPEGPTDYSEQACERLRRLWAHVLVDEFQDTDEVQWKIFESIFHGHANLTLIGDPKQAIYGFRGGDLPTYERAVESASVKETLEYNYRADPELIASLKHLLEGATLGSSIRPVPTIKAGKKETEVILPAGEPRVRVRVTNWEGEVGRGGVPAIAGVRGIIRDDVVTQVSRILNGDYYVHKGRGAKRQANGGDIAVLCLSNSEVADMHKALTDKGISAVIMGGENVFSSPGATQWRTLMHALASPGSGQVGAVALSVFFGRTIQELSAHGDQVRMEVATELEKYVEVFQSYGVGALYEEFQNQEPSLATRVLAHDGGERLLTDLRQVAELMHEEHRASSAGEIWRWLSEKQHDTKSRQNPRRLESDEQAVHLSTLHSAKGMQYPFVFLPSLITDSNPSVKKPIFHDGTQRAIHLAPKLPGPVKKKIQGELEDERARLMYVGLTRGEGQVITYWAPTTAMDRKPYHQLLGRTGAEINPKAPAPTIAEQLRSSWPATVGIEIIEGENISPPQRTRTGSVGAAKTWDRHIDLTWRRASYSSLAKDEPPTGLVEFTEEPLTHENFTEEQTGAHVPSPMAELPRGRQFGSLVHGVLETVDLAAPNLEEEVGHRVDEQLRIWPEDLDPALLTTAITAVLTTPLTPAMPHPLVDLDPRKVLAELEFEMPMDGGAQANGANVTLGDFAPILKKHLPSSDPLAQYAAVLASPAYAGTTLRGFLTGSIDLVFASGEKYYVADYKTNWIGPTDQPQTTATYTTRHLNEAMEGSTYPLQALLYTVAIHRYLRWRLHGYDPSQHIGGVLYLYVRGMAGTQAPDCDGHTPGVFFWQPPAELIIELSDLLDGRRPA